jgi:hypothetical protein
VIILLSLGPREPEYGELPAASMKRCPDCAEWVQAEARICRFCRYRLPEAPDYSGLPPG